MEPLWRLLEDQSTWAGVRMAWKLWLGDVLASVERWLRPREELACSVPGNDGRWLRVVEHTDGDLVAVDDDAGVSCTLAHSDRIVYELDCEMFMRQLTEILQLVGDPEEVGRRAWRLGDFTPVAGYRFPTFLLVADSRESMLAQVGLTSSLTTSPFVVIAPTDRWYSEPVRSLLRDRGSVSTTLSELVRAEQSQLHHMQTIADACRDFLNQHIPVLRGASQPRFSTPPGAQWRDVSIRFVDGHIASVSVGETHQRCSFDDMGLGDKRSRQPTVLWELLLAFADGHGELGWTSSAATRSNQKRKERLADRLQAFFGIDGDPFEYVDALKCWKTRFAIEPI